MTLALTSWHSICGPPRSLIKQAAQAISHHLAIAPCMMMSLPMDRLICKPLVSLLRRISAYLRSRLISIFSYGRSAFDLRPLTDQQRRQKIEEFIDSINTEAVRALASANRGGLECYVRRLSRGSFNVCYVLDFPEDGSTRMVRIPIVPSVYDAWGKVRSEVCTLQYV